MRLNWISFGILLALVNNHVIAQNTTNPASRPDQPKPYLGVSVKDWISATPPKDGAVVDAVEDGTPAAQVGVQASDIITMLNDKKIHSAKDFDAVLSLCVIGKPYSIGIIRTIQQGRHTGNKFSQAKVTPIRLPADAPLDPAQPVATDPINIAIHNHKIIKAMTEAQIKLAMKYPPQPESRRFSGVGDQLMGRILRYN